MEIWYLNTAASRRAARDQLFKWFIVLSKAPRLNLIEDFKLIAMPDFLNIGFEPTLRDSWISGFIDAEGCFNITIFKRKAMKFGIQVKLRFMLDHKDSLDSLLLIKDQLNLFLTNRKLKKGNIGSMHRIEINSFVKVPLIINYINNFNLKSKKQESFNKWVKAYELVKNKAHLTENGLIEIRNLSKKVNLITSITKKTGEKLL